MNGGFVQVAEDLLTAATATELAVYCVLAKRTRPEQRVAWSSRAQVMTDLGRAGNDPRTVSRATSRLASLLADDGEPWITKWQPAHESTTRYRVRRPSPEDFYAMVPNGALESLRDGDLTPELLQALSRWILECWRNPEEPPSLGEFAQRYSCDITGARRHRRELVTLGFLTIEYHRGRPSITRLTARSTPGESGSTPREDLAAPPGESGSTPRENLAGAPGTIWQTEADSPSDGVQRVLQTKSNPHHSSGQYARESDSGGGDDEDLLKLVMNAIARRHNEPVRDLSLSSRTELAQRLAALRGVGWSEEQLLTRLTEHGLLGARSVEAVLQKRLEDLAGLEPTHLKSAREHRDRQQKQDPLPPDPGLTPELVSRHAAAVRQSLREA